jgi:hypothetical protein
MCGQFFLDHLGPSILHRSLCWPSRGRLFQPEFKHVFRSLAHWQAPGIERETLTQIIREYVNLQKSFVLHILTG